MKSIALFPLLLLNFAVEPVASGVADSLLGKWYTSGKKAIFDFYKVGEEYRARLIPLARPNMIDKRNPVDSLKTRRISGTTTIWNLTYNPQKRRWEGGRVYNPENGKTYFCHCRLLKGGDNLQFRGYLVVSALGQSKIWTRKSGE